MRRSPLPASTAERAFNSYEFEVLKLNAKQEEAIGSMACHQVRRDKNGPVFSWYATVDHGQIPTNLEVLRIRKTDDGQVVIERRVGVDLPDFIEEIVSQKTPC